MLCDICQTIFESPKPQIDLTGRHLQRSHEQKEHYKVADSISQGVSLGCFICSAVASDYFEPVIRLQFIIKSHNLLEFPILECIRDHRDGGRGKKFWAILTASGMSTTLFALRR